jgi:predicted phage terminase large subunit-like protein
MREAKFQAQYQQVPLAPAGIYVKPAWFKTFTELPAQPDMILQSWDTASKTDEIHDFSVCTTWAILDRHAYLLDVFREKLEFPALRRKVEELAQRHNADTILIEDTVSGTALIQQLREDGIGSASAVAVTGDKEMRFMAQTAKIESGLVHLPKDAQWRDAYVAELTSFPNGNHDDQVDSTTNALKWMSDLGETPGLGLLRYYQNLSSADGGTEKPKLVRLKLPPCRTYQFPVAPWSISVGEDGIVEVPEEAEVWLRRAGGERLD